tara:strand:+ start:4280 stop:5353 length:1074 start_codon:yes stop_codon:yes gene_type:complete
MQKLLEELIEVGATLRKENGMYVASNGEHYMNFSWIRDIYYQAKPSLLLNKEEYRQTYTTLTDYYMGLNRKYDNKLQWLIDDPQIDSSCFIHPRFHHENLDEITSNWGNVQLDTFGYYILAIVEGMEEGIVIPHAEEVCFDLIRVLDSIEYWDVHDNAIWEENAEVHASSVGAVISGLVHFATYFNIEDDLMIEKLVMKGLKVLEDLLPCESISKEVDLALLTLIYPFSVLDKEMSQTLVDNVTEQLERKRGVIRYHGDAYYNSHPNSTLGDRLGEELEWCMGFAFLAHAHKQLGNDEEAEKYFQKLLVIHELNKREGIPEGYYAKTNQENDNQILGWPTGMMIDYIVKYKKDGLNK